MSVHKIPVGVLPVASTSFGEATFHDQIGDALLKFDFSREGVWYRGGISFEAGRSYRFRAESYCTPWHMEGAYDTLVEVMGSPWIAELHEAESEAGSYGPWVLRHFMIYIDRAGCFEVVAAAWAWLPEELAT